MNITFIIGNGFDKNLGMRTGYEDFYKWYLEQNEYFAKVIKNDMASGIETWADLELALGEYTQKLKEDEVGLFMDEKDNLDVSLSNYLKMECEGANIDYAAASEKFRMCIANFNEYLEEKYRLEYNNWLRNVSGAIDYKIITLNYTDILEKIYNHAIKTPRPELKHIHISGRPVADKVSKPLYLHGKIDNGIILGVGNKNQIYNEIFRNEASCADYFVKELINGGVGDRRVEKAKKIIDNSQYVCLFGTSIGETDAPLWEYISKWLSMKVDRRLILFMRDKSFKPASASSLTKRKDYYRSLFLDRAKVGNVIRQAMKEKIVVCLNANIFGLNKADIILTD